MIEQLSGFIDDVKVELDHYLKEPYSNETECLIRVLESGLIPDKNWCTLNILDLAIKELNNKNVERIKKLCIENLDSNNGQILGRLGVIYRDGLHGEKNIETAKSLFRKAVKNGSDWYGPLLLKLLINEKNPSNIAEIENLCSEYSSGKYPYILPSIAEYYYTAPLGHQDIEKGRKIIKTAIDLNVPDIKKLYKRLEYASGSIDVSLFKSQFDRIANPPPYPNVDVNLSKVDKKLKVNVVGECSVILYELFCNRQCIETTKTNSIEHIFNWNDSGIYYVSATIKIKGHICKINSKPIDCICDENFDTFINENGVELKSLEYTYLNPPYYDFVIAINSTIESFDDSIFNREGYVIDGKPVSILFLGKLHKLKDCVKFFSGVTKINHTIIRGQDNLDDETIDIIDENCTGNFSLFKIDKTSISICSDYFGMSKIYYYDFDGKVYISNRYHLLELALVKDGIELEIDNSLALSYFYTYEDDLTLQPVTNDMLVKNTHLLPVGFFLKYNNNRLYLEKTDLFDCIIDPPSISSEYYSELVKATGDEIISDLKDVLNSKLYDHYFLDVTGGIDSRIIFSALTNINNAENYVWISTKPFNENEINCSSKLVEKTDFNYSPEIMELVTHMQIGCRLPDPFRVSVSDYIEMITSLSIDSYDPSALIPFYSLNRTLHLTGFVGEAFTRPYMNRHVLNWSIQSEDESQLSHEYVCRMSKKAIVSYEVAGSEFEKHLTETLKLMPGTNWDKFESLYLCIASKYHFDLTNHYGFSTDIWMPLMSKKAFTTMRTTMNQFKSYKFAFDLIEYLNKNFSQVQYNNENDNISRLVNVQKLCSDNQNQRSIEICTKPSDRYCLAKEESKNLKIEFAGVDIAPIPFSSFIETRPLYNELYFRTMQLFRGVVKRSSFLKKSIGLPIYHFLTNLDNGEFNGYNQTQALFYTYKKIAAIAYILKLNSNGLTHQKFIKRLPPKIQISKNKILME